MLDIHSHVLPGIDDGSPDAAESVRLVKALSEQDVQILAATPHFYATMTTPDRFLERRQESVNELLRVWQPEFPHLLLGAEVHYFEGISRAEEMKRLQIGDTGLLLVEMPFRTWTGRMIDEILALQNRPDTDVLLAHIERYLKDQRSSVWQSLRSSGVRMQCNAEFFIRRETRRKALKMLRNGEIQFLGSDCHNMEVRPPRIGEAMEIIDRATGKTGRQILYREAEIVMKRTGAPE